MPTPIALFWFRRDLRLHDNAGLFETLSSGLPVIPLFIFDSEILSSLEDKADKRVSFIYDALLQMQEKLTPLDSGLDVRYGKQLDVFLELLSTYPVEAVYTNHDYEPYATQRDEAVRQLLAENGVAFHTVKDQVIFEKDEVTKDDGSSYSVFTPFAKKWRANFEKEKIRAYPSEKLLEKMHKQRKPPFPSLEQIGFSFDKSISSIPSINTSIIRHYHKTRDIPSIEGTTHLGVHLRFGTGSIRKLVAKALDLNATFLTELIWREFFMQTLWHQPRLVNEACKKEYDNIKWRNNEAEFEKWCQGQTGYPIVDAGMRELNETGFMHNRVRMITASFLIKDLLIDWRWGEAYFASKLLDYELSSNNGNWQWAAGCGCDAAPYFRVFNPSLQAKKFDPKGLYVRQWIPELTTKDYPRPMVDHDQAKQRCLKAYKAAVQRKEITTK